MLTDTMVTTAGPHISTTSLPPKNPLPYWQRVTAGRRFDTGIELLRGSVGSVTRNVLGPKWVIPPLVLVSSPKGARDVLARRDAFAEVELVLPHHEWLPRRRELQNHVAGHHVPRFVERMAEVAELLADRWAHGAAVDLDADCRAMTMRALGHSTLGIDLGHRTEVLGTALRASITWAADRGSRPINPPRWWPTRGQRKACVAGAALHTLAAQMLLVCRADPRRDAPLVRTLMQTIDPETGQPLSDRAICDELVSVLLAGHDTTATALTYALWALGHRSDLQERVAAEAAAIGTRRLTHEDVPRLRYTVQVLQEALRLCPPAPAVGRMVLADIEVDGCRVPAGTIALVAIYAIHRDPALWEDPLSFDPDRFSPERCRGRDRWRYLPFGGGPRACISDHFAILEAALALATILRQVEIVSRSRDFPTVTPLAMIAAAPIRANVGPRAH